MSLTATPDQVRADATSLLVFIGPANRSGVWSLVGSGTLDAITNYTDGQGRAYAKYTPGNVGDTVTVSFHHGA